VLDGEPYLIVRARDRLSASAIYAYATMVVAAGHGLLEAGEHAKAVEMAHIAEELEALAELTIDWQGKHAPILTLPKRAG
jgi:disulfide bond formation protein DsbB